MMTAVSESLIQYERLERLTHKGHSVFLQRFIATIFDLS